MSVHCFTSFTFSYLARARVLAETLRRHHPDWTLWAVITDRPPPGITFDATASGFDRTIGAEDLLGAGAEGWLFGHTLVEACTAVKARALQHILDEGAERVVFLDPDIAVFAPLDPVLEGFEGASLLLTPHQVEPARTAASLVDNEMSALRHGVFNLGFLGVSNTPRGRGFARWWAERLALHCRDRREAGLFVDQKWCDLVPALFEGVRVLRDPGCNVASWNIAERHLAIDRDGAIRANGAALRFFHFSKLGPVADAVTRRHGADSPVVFELWDWYRRRVAALTDPAIPEGWWWYGRFANGVPVPDDARRLYRDRPDLQAAFPRPFSADPPALHDWLAAEGAL